MGIKDHNIRGSTRSSSWLKKKEEKESSVILPEVGGATCSANNINEVQKVDTRKRGSYYRYDDEMRAKIAKYASMNAIWW